MAEDRPDLRMVKDVVTGYTVRWHEHVSPTNHLLNAASFKDPALLRKALAAGADPKRAVSTAANDCRARGDALRAQLETTTEERDEYQNSVIKLEQQLKEAKDERDAATKAAGVIQAKLDAANEDIEKNQVILEEKDVFIKTLIQTPKGK